MLTNSPWAWELKVLRETALGSSDSSQGQQFVSYLIQFQSALPIRQAKVRQAQLQNKYDTLSKEQKQAFDKSTEAFLNADYSDKVVVSVTYSTNIQKLNEIQNMDMELARTWQSKTLGVLSNSVFLYASKGEKAHLLDFNVGQGAQRSFQFIFPRQVGGKPIATDQDKSLILEFPYPADDAWKMGTGRGYAEFKVKKMILNGGLIY
ncbi:MAG TPA: hypothetical protein VMG30_13970 [Acidobacteriota bacterium]|nr:hypothetical protein [Acidobacteriota bacterium]